MGYTLRITRGAPAPASLPCLYTLRRRDEMFFLAGGDDTNYYWRYAPDGSFGQIGGGGIDRYIMMHKPELDFIFSEPDNARLRNWAMLPGKGVLYIYYDEATETARWPVTLQTSTRVYHQTVRVLQKGIYKKLTAALPPSECWLVDAIPYQASGDYSAYTRVKHPEMWLEAFADFLNGEYGPSHTFPDGSAYTFHEPIFDMATFPDVSASAREWGGMYFDVNCFGEIVP